MKQSSDPALFMAPGSSLPSVELLKSVTSNTVLLDDIESRSTRHKIIMDGYNGAGKSTIEREEEKKLAGSIINFNITAEDKMYPKEDDGRTIFQYYPEVKEADPDSAEAFEDQVEHREAMKNPGAPRDFLAQFGCRNFSREPNERSRWQLAQKEAMKILEREGVEYSPRKLISYAQPLTFYLLLEEAVERSDNPR